MQETGDRIQDSGFRLPVWSPAFRRSPAQSTPQSTKQSVRCTGFSLLPTGKAGLTLIEVMLALVILGISLVGLTAATSRCLAIARKARNYENARRLLGQIELTDPLFDQEIEPGDDGGTFESPYEDYKWTRTIEQIGEEGDDEEGLYKITMRVIWSERGQDNKEEVVTYLYAPESAEGGSFE